MKGIDHCDFLAFLFSQQNPKKSTYNYRIRPEQFTITSTKDD